MKIKMIPYRTASRRRDFEGEEANTLYLMQDDWDDFQFKTYLRVFYVDSNSKTHSLGEIKMGFLGQTKEEETYQKLIEEKEINHNYFSLGQSPEYYEKLKKFEQPVRDKILNKLQDVIYNHELLKKVATEDVFHDSLCRDISDVTQEQFKRILDGGERLTGYDFRYQHDSGETIDFKVEPNSLPPTNIHTIIGRNGSGKTSLLDHIAKAVRDDKEEVLVIDTEKSAKFSKLVTVSFSLFDRTESFSTASSKHPHIGINSLQEIDTDFSTKFPRDFSGSLTKCLFGSGFKRQHWKEMVKILSSDKNFRDLDLLSLAEIESKDHLQEEAKEYFSKLSSGHSIILLTLTQLIAYVEEKTLVLLDEPEAHLHPPLLSAFIRALSQLLRHQNGVAIISTHSPVVLQEVPKSCVTKIIRNGDDFNFRRPDFETFGENVGTLTRDVFGLEVENSGFHTLLKSTVKEHPKYNFEKILELYGGHLSFEGKAILRALIRSRLSEEDRL